MREVSHCTPYDVPMDEDCYRLSTGSSIGSNERLSTTTVSDCSLGGDLHEGERPVSLISTVSLGSCSSWEGQAVGDFTHHLDLSLSGGGSRGRAQPLNTSTTSMSPNPKLTYVDRVVMEIIETERMYVKDLRNIVEDYLAHIIDTNDLPIQPEQVCALFGNIEDIYEFNSELLQSMEECDYAPVAIAHCFVHRSQYFDIYTQYCTNYPNSVATLTECMRNTILAKFFRDRQASLKLSLPLGSYLLKPVQRILKYHLLLQEIAKHFDPEEEGYDVVEEALYTMTGVAWYINDMKRKHEHAVRLQEIQSLLINWKGPDLTTYGELVLEGVFRVHRAKNERTFFLFDRMLLITKKRGEDYVYKTHILCSTLMLVESAKDSLCFSVTHYKHPKQPHTVQARTIEEKRLWAHHIKRLILENHHAIIPEKAKEAILEMDSVYPKYRYHRDRLKGCAPSCEDCISAGRVGQGVSDPTKHIFRSSKVLLKRADSEGTRPGAEPTTSVGVLGCSLRGCPVEPERELTLSSSESEERLAGVESDDEALLENNPLEDFASSMLAAISCWHYRAQALLSLWVTTDEEGNEIIEENKCISENNQTQSQETAVAGLELNQAASDGPLGQTNYVSEFGGKFDMSKTSDAAIFGRNVLKNMPSHSDKVTPTKWFEREPEKKRAGAKTLSSGESSEEEHKSERAASCRIRPSSVLNQASIIVEHFSSSTRRASGISEDQRLLSSPGPRLASRTSSSASLSNDVLEKVAKTGYSTREDLTVLSQGHENLPEVELAGCHRRRDSSLSKQDQLLIDKIKSYYEHAEQEDGGFGLKRRESLTFIPAGLVQNSIIRLNGNPKDDAPSNTMQCNKGLYITSSDQEEVVTFSRVDSKSPLDSPIDNIAHNLGEITLKEEEFHPFIDMIRIWKEMERDVNRSQEELRVGMRFKHPQQLYKEESSNINKIGKFLIDDQATNPSSEALKGLGLVDLRTIVEESFNPSHVKDSEGTSGLVGSVERVGNFLVNPDNCGGFESANKLDDVFQEEDMGKNKVLQLARQYSQRLKGVKPSVIQKTQETEKLRDADSMFWQQKEKWPTGDEGKLSQAPPLMPLLTPFDYMFLPKLSCVAQPSPAQQECSLSESPECFSWPDVQQLRSRYIPHVSLVSQRCSRCSLHLSTDTSPEIGRERKPCQVVVQEQVAMATRSCHMTEADMAAQKVGDDNYVQICSSTTQDNISIMTVVDHSKAYKETEKKGRTQAGPPAIQVKEHVQDTGCGQQSVLKNLREKFLDTKPNF